MTKANAPTSKSEEADDYHAIVARLNDHWRVIECAAGLQWILQRAAGQRHGRTRWVSQSFCRTREALIRLSHATEPRAAAILSELPERRVRVLRGNCSLRALRFG
jgi:hypothetical protein